MPLKLREHQLTLLGQLPAATITITLHVNEGTILRQWWITGADEKDDQVLCWSDATSEGPHGGLNLAELLTELLAIARMLREPSPPQ